MMTNITRIQQQHVANDDPEDSEETGSEDENENNNEDSEEEEEEEEEEVIKDEARPTLCRSNRVRTPNFLSTLTTSNTNTEEVYTEETGALIALTM